MRLKTASCSNNIIIPIAAVSESAQFADDLVQLQHGVVMYDALYAWCRR